MQSSPPPTALPRAAPPEGRVLFCDDSPTMRALVRSLLGERYELLLAETAEEALEQAPAFAPDLILSDLLLPGMSGRALCRTIRADPALAAVPFVLLTTLADADARADGLEAGADDYLAKPVRERELLARVASLVRLRRVLVALEARTVELTRANAALEATREELVRAERRAAMGSLAADLAHELTNPLAYLKAGASSLAGALDDARAAAAALAESAPSGAPARERLDAALGEAREIAGAVHDGSRRLERLAAALREAAWPEAGEPKVVPGA